MLTCTVTHVSDYVGWHFTGSCIDIRPPHVIFPVITYESLASHPISSFLQIAFCSFPIFLSSFTSHSISFSLWGPSLSIQICNTCFTDKMEDEGQDCSWSPQCPSNLSASSLVSPSLTSTSFPLVFCSFSKLLPLLCLRTFSFSWTSCPSHADFL